MSCTASAPEGQRPSGQGRAGGGAAASGLGGRGRREGSVPEARTPATRLPASSALPSPSAPTVMSAHDDLGAVGPSSVSRKLPDAAPQVTRLGTVASASAAGRSAGVRDQRWILPEPGRTRGGSGPSPPAGDSVTGKRRAFGFVLLLFRHFLNTRCGGGCDMRCIRSQCLHTRKQPRKRAPGHVRHPKRPPVNPSPQPPQAPGNHRAALCPAKW